MSVLDPWADPLGSGFQIIQSFIAVGTGGITGLGFMRGIQKLFYLPEAHTDFIYAVSPRSSGSSAPRSCSSASASSPGGALRVALRAPDSFGAFSPSA